jgi:hypothetical protein
MSLPLRVISAMQASRLMAMPLCRQQFVKTLQMALA